MRNVRKMNPLHGGFPTRVARCSTGSLPFDGQEALGWCHLELLQHRRGLRCEAGALHDRRLVYPVTHGLDLVEDQTEVAPRVARPDLRRPLEEQGQHTELDMAGDPGRRPVGDRADAQPRGLEAPEAGLDGMISNDKFCCTRWGVLQLSWWRRPNRLRR